MNSFVSFHFNHLKVNRTVMLTRTANLDIFHFEYCLFRKYFAGVIFTLLSFLLVSNKG